MGRRRQQVIVPIEKHSLILLRIVRYQTPPAPAWENCSLLRGRVFGARIRTVSITRTWQRKSNMRSFAASTAFLNSTSPAVLHGTPAPSLVRNRAGRAHGAYYRRTKIRKVTCTVPNASAAQSSGAGPFRPLECLRRVGELILATIMADFPLFLSALVGLVIILPFLLSRLSQLLKK